jgi:hypothetical protein
LIKVYDLAADECNTNLAIAVKQFVARRRQNHVGILYKTDGNPLSLLHLRWHHELQNEAPDPSYFWLPTKLDPRVVTSFVEWLGVVWERNKAGAVPFSVLYSGRYFEADGKLARSDIGDGLTCATFVCALFADFALPLIDADTWPKSPTLRDKQWHREILEELGKKADPAHVAKQRLLMGRASRFRPEQTAGAFGVFTGAPVKHDVASAMAKIVEDAIRITN